jgi:hypothetical protein
VVSLREVLRGGESAESGCIIRPKVFGRTEVDVSEGVDSISKSIEWREDILGCLLDGSVELRSRRRLEV